MSLVQRYEQHANSHNFSAFEIGRLLTLKTRKRQKRFRHDGFFN